MFSAWVRKRSKEPCVRMQACVCLFACLFVLVPSPTKPRTERLQPLYFHSVAMDLHTCYEASPGPPVDSSWQEGGWGFRLVAVAAQAQTNVSTLAPPGCPMKWKTTNNMFLKTWFVGISQTWFCSESVVVAESVSKNLVIFYYLTICIYIYIYT